KLSSFAFPGVSFKRLFGEDAFELIMLIMSVLLYTTQQDRVEFGGVSHSTLPSDRPMLDAEFHACPVLPETQQRDMISLLRVHGRTRKLFRKPTRSKKCRRVIRIRMSGPFIFRSEETAYESSRLFDLIGTDCCHQRYWRRNDLGESNSSCAYSLAITTRPQ